MQGFYGNFGSIKDSFIDKQQTDIGRAARDGDIVDREPIIIKCSNCGKELVTIKVTRPYAKIKSFIIAECCHCSDKSFKQEIIGSFIIGGTDITSIIDYPMETDIEGEFFIQKVLVKTKVYGRK